MFGQLEEYGKLITSFINEAKVLLESLKVQQETILRELAEARTQMTRIEVAVATIEEEEIEEDIETPAAVAEIAADVAEEVAAEVVAEEIQPEEIAAVIQETVPPATETPATETPDGETPALPETPVPDEPAAEPETIPTTKKKRFLI